MTVFKERGTEIRDTRGRVAAVRACPTVSVPVDRVVAREVLAVDTFSKLTANICRFRSSVGLPYVQYVRTNHTVRETRR